MNTLAHLVLAGPDPDLRLGAFLGDFLPGPLPGPHAPGLAQGLAPAELLTPSTAAWTLLAGFATETMVVAYRALRPRALAP